jgi:hypothetical protein
MLTRSQLAVTLAVALGTGALAGPAGASPEDLRSPDVVDATSPPAQDLRSPDAAAAETATPAPDVAPPSVAATASAPESSSGFEWGSAAIGAAGAVGLIAVAAGGGMTVRRHRGAHPSGPVAH